MKSLIIPCAGQNKLKGNPKWLTKHPDGKLLIEKCISGINMDQFDRFIITILKEDDINFNASNIISHVLSKYENLEILILENRTNGPAETIYQTIVRLKVEGAIIIKDADVFITVPDIKFNNFVAGLNLIEYDADLPNIRNKSFITINEQNHILDIIEKHIKSDIICLGLYGIKHSEDFIEAYEALIDENYEIPILYVSHIIAYLIGKKGYIFHYIKILSYENWETEKDWHKIEKKLGTYFIDLDKILNILSNDSSVKVNYEEISKKFKMMKQLEDNGAKIVLFTSIPLRENSLINKMINEYSLQPLSIIYDCSHSIKKIIRNTEDLKSYLVEVS